MNIFELAPEFIEWDNRKDRNINRVTAESTYNRLSVQLPQWLVKDQTILDLGSCLGAAGHMALTNGARHYTGVEIQSKYVEDSRTILSKYWQPSQFNIVQENLEDFLDNCISNNIKYDHVIASGVLYAFLDIVKILEKISLVTANVVLIDTMFVRDGPRGIILIREDTPMIYAEGQRTFTGIGTSCNLTALDIIMKTTGFYRKEDPIVPPVTTQSHDGYSDSIEQIKGITGPSRYSARYYKREVKLKKLIDTIIENRVEDARDFGFQVPNITEAGRDKVWTFDDGVAARFQTEAETNIPDYKRVIDLCLTVAGDNLQPTDTIIDIGSALGYTVDQFVRNGFVNMQGLDNSESMVRQSLHPERIMLADALPDSKFKMILINWTLHFIVDKYEYVQDLYNKLDTGGYLIISDKTTQTPEVKKLYYDFKRDNGVSEEYIRAKEKKLVGYMHTMPADWYAKNLERIGFASVEVINARLGFITFLCKK